MNMVINSTPAPLFASPVIPLATEASKEFGKPTALTPSSARVTISADAQRLHLQEQAADKTPLTKTELQAIYHRSDGASSWTVGFISQINSQGKSSELLLQEPATRSPERLAQAKQAASFVFVAHTTLNRSGNPYDSLSRDELSGIFYDETGEHTLAERYLAGNTRQRRDFEFLTRNLSSAGIPYPILIAFHDAQSAVERSIYPEGHREQLVSFLKDAETYGYPNTEEMIWDPWTTKYLRKVDPNSPIAEHTLISAPATKTTESGLSDAKKLA